MTGSFAKAQDTEQEGEVQYEPYGNLLWKALLEGKLQANKMENNPIDVSRDKIYRN